MFNLVARMVHDRGLAEDLSQDAFVKCVQPSRHVSARTGKVLELAVQDRPTTPPSTTYDAAQSTTVSLEAGGEDEPDYASTTPDPSAGSPLDSMLQGDLAAALSTAIDHLRPEYREVMVLRHQEGLAYEEIARDHGAAPGHGKDLPAPGTKGTGGRAVSGRLGPHRARFRPPSRELKPTPPSPA